MISLKNRDPGLDAEKFLENHYLIKEPVSASSVEHFEFQVETFLKSEKKKL